MCEEISGIICDVCLVNFTVAPESQGPFSIAWGTVVRDFKGRFPSGAWMHTSCVEKVEGNLIYTMNSLYQVEGDMEVVTLPEEILPALYEGVPPGSVKFLMKNGYSFILPCTGKPITLDHVEVN